MATVNYTITSNFNDSWSGSFTVSSLTNLVFSEAGTPTSVAAGSYGFVPDNISYYNPGYVTWRSATDKGQFPSYGRSLDIWSLDLYDDIVNSKTWQYLQGKTYALTNGKNNVYYDYDTPVALYWGQGGTISFS